MKVVLTHNDLKKAFAGKSKKPDSMNAEQWEELDEKTLSSIKLSLSKEVLREVIRETIAASLWLKLESLYMTKSLANKLCLKERLYTLRMSEGSSIQSHLDAYNSIIIDLENLEVKFEDENKVVLLIVSLPSTYKHFKEIMLYGNNKTLSYEYVESNLLSKEKFDLDVHSEDKGEGLFVRGRSQDKGSTSKRKFRSTSKGHNFSKTCCYCKKPGHDISNFYKLKNKNEREETNKKMQKVVEAGVVESDSEGDVLLAISDDKRNSSKWVFDTGSTYHMCPHKDWFVTYDKVECGVVLMGNDAQ
ncbi:hypothetical protein KY285_001040 [Solanum tuberosum]|nr:hypothetical protein KY285_001040 [Solanum tuberosum]